MVPRVYLFFKTLKIRKTKKNKRNKKWFAGLAIVAHGNFLRQKKNCRYVARTNRGKRNCAQIMNRMHQNLFVIAVCVSHDRSLGDGTLQVSHKCSNNRV